MPDYSVRQIVIEYSSNKLYWNIPIYRTCGWSPVSIYMHRTVRVAFQSNLGKEGLGGLHYKSPEYPHHTELLQISKAFEQKRQAEN